MHVTSVMSSSSAATEGCRAALHRTESNTADSRPFRTVEKFGDIANLRSDSCDTKTLPRPIPWIFCQSPQRSEANAYWSGCRPQFPWSISVRARYELSRALSAGRCTALTTAATLNMINPLVRGSKYEPWIGNDCQHTFDIA